MIDTDDIFEAVVATYERLRPYGKDADPRLRGASYSDSARLSAATSIVRAAMDDARRTPPDDPDADLIEHDDDAERSA